jgi:hypothetical protein
MRSVRSFIAVLALAVATVPGTAWAGTVTLTPTHGPIGTSVTAIGSGYDADHHIAALAWGRAESNPLATAVVDASRGFEMVFTVPQVASTAQIKFWDVEGRSFDVASFTVDSTDTSTGPDTTTHHPPVITSTDTRTDGVMV